MHGGSGDGHRGALRRVSTISPPQSTYLTASFVYSQLRDLSELETSHPSIPVLKDIVRELRDDELGHLDTAVMYDSQKAPAHALLSAVIEAGCGVAIQICKRI